MPRYVSANGDHLGYWTMDDPNDMQELEEMVFEGGRRDYYNFIVTGRPARISPEWLAKHPGWEDGKYDYAVSYSIYRQDMGDMLDDTNTPLDAFNYYIEGIGNEWISIEGIDLVDRKRPWDNTL